METDIHLETDLIFKYFSCKIIHGLSSKCYVISHPGISANVIILQRIGTLIVIILQLSTLVLINVTMLITKGLP